MHDLQEVMCAIREYHEDGLVLQNCLDVADYIRM